MWEKVSRKKIKEEAYSKCLKEAVNYKVYAEIWYLDSLTDQKWFCYVLDDYKAIMPVCYDKKLLMKRIIQPAYCQQLGVFYREGVTQEDFTVVYSLLKKNYVKNYNFNDQNCLNFEFKGKKKKNFLLKLKSPYEQMAADYNNNTKRNVKKANNANLRFNKSKDIHALLGLKRGDSEYLLNQFSKLSKRAIEEHCGEVWEAYGADNQLYAAFFLIHSENYLVYIVAGSTETGKKVNAMSYLVDHVIKEFSESQKILDFEGSQIRGVARFYKGFGGKNIEYKAI